MTAMQPTRVLTPYEAQIRQGQHRPGERGRWKPSKARIERMRREVFARDWWTCQDCGRRILPTCEREWAGVNVPGAFLPVTLTLDHIEPYIDGGLFIAANLRAACSSCNSRRGARPLTGPGGPA